MVRWCHSRHAKGNTRIAYRYAAPRPMHFRGGVNARAGKDERTAPRACIPARKCSAIYFGVRTNWHVGYGREFHGSDRPMREESEKPAGSLVEQQLEVVHPGLRALTIASE